MKAKPKLIYYHDSRHYLMYRFDPPMNLHQLRKPVDDLIGTPVDTIVYGTGMGQTFLYDTKVGYKFGEKAKNHISGLVWWRAEENLRQAIKSGYDPFKIVVDRAHEKEIKLVGSIRINDGGAPEESTYAVGKLKYENPDVMIGEDDPDRPYVSTCLDFARKDVRNERLDVIEEICDRYNADGIEIDEYIRVFFKPSQVEENIPVLTQWMRDVRALLDDIGEKRGQHLSLSVRVHPSERACLDAGMDLRTWIREGLLDWITPFGDVVLLDPKPNFEWISREADKVGTHVYPPLGRETYDDRFHVVTPEMTRATATNFVAAGASGIYLADLPWPHGEQEYQIMREMADPDVYARKTKHYMVAPRAANPDKYMPDRDIPCTLGQGDTGTVEILVSDDLESAISDGVLDSVRLGIRLVQPHPNDTIVFKLNGETLPIADAETSHYYGGTVPYFPVKTGMDMRINTHYWFEFDLPGELIKHGSNLVEVTMEKIYERFTADRVLQSVEVWVKYKDIPTPISGQM